MIELPYKKYNIAKLKKRQHKDLDQYKQVGLKCQKSSENDFIKDIRRTLLAVLTKLDQMEDPDSAIIIEQ